MSREPEVLVVGSGVSGLTTALCLAHAGFRVRVRGAEDPQDSTSSVAGALWGRYLMPDARAAAWTEASRTEFERLADRPGTGVALTRGLEAARAKVPVPAWVRTLVDFSPATPEELPVGFAAGWRYRAPLINMPAYLAYLCGQLRAVGVPVEIAPVASLAEATALADLVVNCTGWAAREFAADPDVTPVSGQIVVVENPGVTEFFAEHDGTAELTYILPHPDRVVLGGSASPHHIDRRPDPALSAAILARCVAVDPRLRDAPVIAERVGLRPARPEVRVDRVSTQDGDVIHNYGHGGAGISLSWGCAQEVVRLTGARSGTALSSARRRPSR